MRRTDPAAAADEGYPLASAPSPRTDEPTDEERARFLATHAAEQLLESGLTELRIDELAREYAARGSDEGGVEEFVAWALAQA